MARGQGFEDRIIFSGGGDGRAENGFVLGDSTNDFQPFFRSAQELLLGI
jgi:hypothetical protein